MNHKTKWRTPDYIIKDLKKRFNVESFFDPCPANPLIDGLEVSWNSPAFVNPPYDNIVEWIEKALMEYWENNVKVIMLLPATTDVKWFHNYIYNQPDIKIEFIKGRIQYLDPDGKPYKGSPRFGSMFVFIGR